MHGHSSDSTNAVIQFIQMEKNVLKILLNGQSVGGTFTFASPQPKCWGTCPPVPPIIAAPAINGVSNNVVTGFRDVRLT